MRCLPGLTSTVRGVSTSAPPSMETFPPGGVVPSVSFVRRFSATGAAAVSVRGTPSFSACSSSSASASDASLLRLPSGAFVRYSR